MKFATIFSLAVLCLSVHTSKNRALTETSTTSKWEGCSVPKVDGFPTVPVDNETKHLELMKKVIPSWETCTLDKKDLSAAGGKKLFLYAPKNCTNGETNVKPIGAVLKIGGDLQATKLSLADRRTNDGTCALQNNESVTPPKLAEGTNFFIQESAGIETTSWDNLYPPEQVGALLATIHKTPTNWCDKYYNDVKAELPWLTVPQTNIVWDMCKDGGCNTQRPIIEGVAALTESIQWNYREVSNKKVTIHGDFHPYNMMYADAAHTKLRAIDLDTMWVQNPTHDAARYMWTTALSYDDTKKFVKTYLKDSNHDDSPAKVKDFMKDMNLALMFDPIEGAMDKINTLCPGYMSKQEFVTPTGMKFLDGVMKEWNEACHDDTKGDKLLRMGLYKYMDDTKNPDWQNLLKECTKVVDPATGMLLFEFLKPNFRLPQSTQSETYEIKGDSAEDALLYFSKNHWMTGAPGMDVSPWTAGTLKGTRLHVQAGDVLDYYLADTDPKNGERFMDMGYKGKTGYPYAFFNSQFKPEVTKKDGKLHLQLKLHDWTNMGTHSSSIDIMTKATLTAIATQMKTKWDEYWTAHQTSTPTTTLRSTAPKKASSTPKVQTRRRRYSSTYRRRRRFVRHAHRK